MVLVLMLEWYNQFMKPHFLQSSSWEKFEQSEGRQTFRLQGKGFSVLAVLETTPIGNYLFCPYGPILDEAKDANELKLYLETSLRALSRLAHDQNAFFVRIEPTIPICYSPAQNRGQCLTYHDLKSLKLKKSHDIDPAHTWVLDLAQPETQIFADMEKERGRLWRNHAKKGITLRQTRDPEQIVILSNLLKIVGEQDHFIPQDKAHLKNQLESGFATLYIAELEGVPIAASLVYDSDNTRFYAHAAANYEHRKLAAGSILLVQMIVDAKAKGLKTFDFWGITTSTDKKTSVVWFYAV